MCGLILSCVCSAGTAESPLFEDIKPLLRLPSLLLEDGALSNPGALQPLLPLHSPMNFSGGAPSLSGQGGTALQSPLHLSSVVPVLSGAEDNTLGVASLLHQPSGMVQQSSFSSQIQALPSTTQVGTTRPFRVQGLSRVLYDGAMY